MTKTITVGASQGARATLPVDVLEEMGIPEESTLYVVKTEAGVLLTSLDPELRESLDAFELLSAKYSNVLRELAK